VDVAGGRYELPDGRVLLDDVSFRVGEGAKVALVGANGAGKTTLLRIIAGFSHPGRGKVRIMGSEPREAATRRKMGFIGHGISVYDELSAIENLMLFGKLYDLPNPRKSALEWLDRTGLARGTQPQKRLS